MSLKYLGKSCPCGWKSPIHLQNSPMNCEHFKGALVESEQLLETGFFKLEVVIRLRFRKWFKETYAYNLFLDNETWEKYKAYYIAFLISKTLDEK